MPFQNGEYRPPENNTTETKNQPRQERYRESQPLSNEPSAGIGIPGQTDVQQTRKVAEQPIFQRLRQSPEVLSLIQAIIDDVIGPGATFDYVGPNPGERGKESIRRAEQFWEYNAENYADSMVDQLVVGDMYIYKRRNEEAQVEQAAQTLLRNEYSIKNEENLKAGAKHITNELKEMTDMFEIKELRPISAATVDHVINSYGDITAYRQEVGGDHIELPQEQVMHDSYMNLNGKTYGFSPFLSLFTELDMIANAKNHNAQVFHNAGVVNKLFKLPDEGPDSANFEMIKKTLGQYRKLNNKHRDLVVTGEVEVEDLSSEEAQMEFRQLAEYVTNVLVMAWGVPPTRVGADIGGGGTRGRATQISHEGYFQRIKRWQRKHQAFLNEELFEPMFNVRIEFNNPDTKQEIRLADRDLRRLEVAKQHGALGLWNEDKIRNYLDINKNQLADNFDFDVFQEKAAELSGLQDMFMEDDSVNGDTSDDGRREMIRDGQEAADSPRDEV